MLKSRRAPWRVGCQKARRRLENGSVSFLAFWLLIPVVLGILRVAREVRGQLPGRCHCGGAHKAPCQKKMVNQAASAATTRPTAHLVYPEPILFQLRSTGVIAQGFAHGPLACRVDATSSPTPDSPSENEANAGGPRRSDSGSAAGRTHSCSRKC